MVYSSQMEFLGIQIYLQFILSPISSVAVTSAVDRYLHQIWRERKKETLKIRENANRRRKARFVVCKFNALHGGLNKIESSMGENSSMGAMEPTTTTTINATIKF